VLEVNPPRRADISLVKRLGSRSYRHRRTAQADHRARPGAPGAALDARRTQGRVRRRGALWLDVLLDRGDVTSFVVSTLRLAAMTLLTELAELIARAFPRAREHAADLHAAEFGVEGLLAAVQAAKPSKRARSSAPGGAAIPAPPSSRCKTYFWWLDALGTSRHLSDPNACRMPTFLRFAGLRTWSARLRGVYLACPLEEASRWCDAPTTEARS
jgi:hypothetical protein